MTIERTARPRTLTLTIAAGVVAASGLGVFLAESAGATTPTASATRTQSTHIVPMGSAPSSPTVEATGSAAAAGPSSQVSTANASVSAPGSAAASGVASTGSAQHVQLTATQLPADSAEKWVPAGTPSTRTVAGHDIGENECAKVDGAITWIQQSFSGGDGQNVAIQDTFGFTSAAAAHYAYQSAVTGMDACQQTTRALQSTNKVPADATVTETASKADAAAWKRNWTGVMGMSADGPQTNHVYFAVDGSRLIVLQFTEFPGNAAPYDVSADPAVLSMLGAELAR